MSNIGLEIFIIFFTFDRQRTFSMSEIALVTARKSCLQELADKKSARARAALDLANKPNQFLSTVQIGITLVGILAGAFGGGVLTEWLSAHLNNVPWLTPYSRSVALTIVVLAITYLSVLVGELVPKRLALGHPEAIAMIMAPVMPVLLKACVPLVHLLSFSTDLVFRDFRQAF